MIKIAVCDDEKYYQKLIKGILQSYLYELQVVFEIDTYESGVELCKLGIEIAKYNIVFLDINMEHYDGIETAKRIRKGNSDIYIVFITAFVSYAVQGYEVDAIRFILKNNINFQEAIGECIDTILKKMKYKIEKRNFIFVKGEKKLSLEKILYIESRQHKIVFHIIGEQIQEYTMYKKLDEMEEQLGGHGFLRIHKSFLVNIRHIEIISNYKVVLTSGEKLPVPKLKYRSVKEKFIIYKGEI